MTTPNDTTARVLAGIVANALNDLALRFAFDGKQHVSERFSEYTQRARALAAGPNAGTEGAPVPPWDTSAELRQRHLSAPNAPAAPPVPEGDVPEGARVVVEGRKWERDSRGYWYDDEAAQTLTVGHDNALDALYHAQQRIAELERMLQAERDAGDIVRASNAEMLAESDRLEAELARLTQAGPIGDNQLCVLANGMRLSGRDEAQIFEVACATRAWWRAGYPDYTDADFVVVDRPATAGEAKADG